MGSTREAVDPHSLRNAPLQDRVSMIVGDNHVLLSGHFDFGNGFHGVEYLNAHELLKVPFVIWQLAELLIERLTMPMKRADFVAGPATGGSFLAFVLAGLLDGHFEGSAPLRKIGEPPKMFVPIVHDAVLRDWVIKPFYGKLISGRKVLLADDVRNTGQTLELCTAKLEAYGAKVVGSCSIFVRTTRALPPIEDREHAFLKSFAQANYTPENCPACRRGEPITKF